MVTNAQFRLIGDTRKDAISASGFPYALPGLTQRTKRFRRLEFIARGGRSANSSLSGNPQDIQNQLW
jgi:hypothetical protein